MRIIMADDDVVFREVLQKTLEKWGHEVIVCSDGAAAWEILQQDDAPRLVILDWMMPGLSGIEICRNVRTLAHGDQFHLLLLSARHKTTDLVEGLQAGASDYLSKPFDRAELKARLEVGIRLIEMQSKLSDQLSFTQSLVDSIPHPIFVKGTDAHFVTFNRAHEQAFGIQREDYIGKTTLDLDSIPESDRRHFQDEDASLLASGGSNHRELNLTYADGQTHTALYSVTAFDRHNGDRAGLLGMHVDVSEQKRLEQDLESALKMASPITKIWEGVLLLPLVGIVDAKRVREIMDASLSAIAEARAKYLIMDISGVANLDGQVADSIFKVMRASQLMGCKGLISGVSPDVARTFVDLDLDLDQAMTMVSLGDAMMHVMRVLGFGYKGVGRSG
jgi:PAS domain S-box-containing protein